MEERDPYDILAEAKRDEARGDLEAAARGYEAFLARIPYDGEARALLTGVHRKREAVAWISARVAEGARQIDAGDFGAAVQSYEEAVARARREDVWPGYRAATRGLALAGSLEQSKTQALELLRRVGPEAPHERVNLLPEFERLLDALPGHPAAGPTREALERGRNQIERDYLSDQARRDRAVAAITAADLQTARRLLEQIPPTSPLHAGASYNLGYIRKTMDSELGPALNEADAAIAFRNWDAARVALRRVPERYQYNPAVRRRLVDLAVAEAYEAFDAGEEALLARAVEDARRHFAHARRVLEPLDRFERLPEAAGQLKEMIADLATITADVAQASTLAAAGDDGDGGHNAAILALNTALARVDRAAGEGRSYQFVAQALIVWRDELTGAISRIAGEMQQLQEAARLLDHGRLAPAEAMLAGLSRAMRLRDRQRAGELRQRLAERRQVFEQAMARGRALAEDDPAAAAAAYREALEVWPEGPEVTNALAESLTRAGLLALAAGDEARALSCFDQALQISPSYPQATAGRAQIQVRQRVASDLAALARAQQSLHEQLETGPDDFAPLLERIQQLTDEAGDLDDLRSEAEELRALVEERQAIRRRFAADLARALAERRAGAWPAAVATLRAAITILGTPPPMAAELDRWEQLARAVAAAEQQTGDLLAQARARYEAAQSPGDLDEARAALRDPVALIEQTSLLVNQAGGDLSPALYQLHQQAIGLGQLVTAAQGIFAAPAPEAALGAAYDVRDIFGSDPFLERLIGQFERERQTRAAGLLAAADAAAAANQLDEAVRLLREATALQPELPGAAERLEAVTALQKLEEQLHACEQEAITSSSSLTSARDALRRGVELFLQPGYSIPPAIQDDLRELLQLADPRLRTDLHRPETWAEAQELRARLLSYDHWSVRRLTASLDRWLSLARDASVHSAITTLAELGQVLRSYEEAVEYRRANPESDAALNYLGNAQRALRATLYDFAEKQLGRARELLDRGEPSAALEHLARLFAEYYDPIAGRFPDLLERMDEGGDLIRQRDDAAQLRARAAELGEQARQADQLLAEGLEHYVQNRYHQVERVLEALPDLTPLPLLRERAERLRARHAQARRELAERNFNSQLTTLEFDLPRCATDEAFVALQQRIDQLRQTEEWSLVGPDVLQRYERLWSNTQTRSALVNSVRVWMDEGRQAYAAGEFARAQTVLQQALQATDDPLLRARLQRDLEEVRQKIEILDACEQALNQGRLAIEQGEYSQAGEILARAMLLSHQLPPNPARNERLRLLAEAARAGVRLQQARAIWERGTNLEQGQEQITLARRQLTAPDQFHALSEEIAYYEDRFQRRYDELQTAINTARETMQRGDFPAARRHIKAALNIDRESGAAQFLGEELENLEQARTRETQITQLMRQFEQERRRGNERRALDLIDRVLAIDPGHTTAQALRLEVEATLESSEQIRLVQQSLYTGKFNLARRKLAELASTLSEGQLGDLRRVIEEQEAAYRSANITPIRDMLRGGRFSEALRRVNAELRLEEEKSALEREYLSGPIREELEQLRLAIGQRARDWTLEQLSEARATGLPGPYRLVVERLTPLLQEPGLPDAAELSRSLHQAATDLLSARLDLTALALKTLAAGSALPASDPALSQQLAVAPRTLAEARQEAEQVSRAAAEQQLRYIQQRADDLYSEADRLLREQASQEVSERFLSRLAAVRQTLALAGQQHDPDSAVRLVRQAREEFTGAQADAAAQGLLGATGSLASELADLDKAIQATEQQRERTERAIESCRRSLLQGDITAAAAQLAAGGPWPPFHAAFAHLDALVSGLERAEQLRSGEQWEEALDAYDATFARDNSLNLARVYAVTLKQCRESFTARLLDRVTAQIAANEGVERSAELLDNAQRRGWLAVGMEAQVSMVRERIAARRRLAEAQAALSQEGDPLPALNALREARRLDPTADFEQLASPWEVLALATVAARHGDLDGAYQHLSALPPGLAELPAARRLRETVVEQLIAQAYDRARAALQHYQIGRAAAALSAVARYALADERLEQLRADMETCRLTVEQVDAAIGRARELAGQGDWSAAADELAAARSQTPSYERLEVAIAELLRRIEAAARAAQGRQQFAAALELCAIGERLGRSETLERVARETQQRRRERYEQEAHQLQQAIAAGDLDQADRLLPALAVLQEEPDQVAAMRRQRDNLALLRDQCRAAMDEGWRTLARLDDQSDPAGALEIFSAARACFARAENAALPETRRWSSAVQAMVEALQSAEQARQEPIETRDFCYERARAWLQRAARQLQPDPDAPAPAILGSPEQLHALRRRFADHALALAARVDHILDLLRRFSQQEERGDHEAAPATLDELDLKVGELHRAARTPAPPPSG